MKKCLLTIAIKGQLKIFLNSILAFQLNTFVFVSNAIASKSIFEHFVLIFRGEKYLLTILRDIFDIKIKCVTASLFNYYWLKIQILIFIP